MSVKLEPASGADGQAERMVKVKPIPVDTLPNRQRGPSIAGACCPNAPREPLDRRA
jgi:hypothetical protein